MFFKLKREPNYIFPDIKLVSAHIFLDIISASVRIFQDIKTIQGQEGCLQAEFCVYADPRFDKHRPDLIEKYTLLGLFVRFNLIVHPIGCKLTAKH